MTFEKQTREYFVFDNYFQQEFYFFEDQYRAALFHFDGADTPALRFYDRLRREYGSSLTKEQILEVINCNRSLSSLPVKQLTMQDAEEMRLFDHYKTESNFSE